MLLSSPHFPRFLVALFMAMIVAVASYFAMYYWTFFSSSPGSNLSLLKSDVLQMERRAEVMTELEELGYRVEELFPVGNHRATEYFADILHAYEPQRVENDGDGNEYLMRDESGEYHFVTDGAELEIVKLVE